MVKIVQLFDTKNFQTLSPKTSIICEFFNMKWVNHRKGSSRKMIERSNKISAESETNEIILSDKKNLGSEILYLSYHRIR